MPMIPLHPVALSGLLAVGPAFRWTAGTPMPMPLGGHAAALVDGLVLVAGGTTWQNGQKRWLREVRTYDPAAGRWQLVGELPEPVAYAVRIGARGSLYLLGGSDGRRGSAGCSRLRLSHGRLSTERLPDLPAPRVYAAGDAVGDHLYVVGGCPDPDHLEGATATLFALDLNHPDSGWRVLAPLPGRPRVVFAAAACAGGLCVFGGCHLDEQGAVANLADAYRYLPESGRWERLPDLPQANRGLTAIGASAGQDPRDQPAGGRIPRVLLFGGFTATAAECQGKGDDFGFVARILRIEPASGAYQEFGELPRATCDAVPVRVGQRVLLFGGEPAKRQRGDWVWIGDPTER